MPCIIAIDGNIGAGKSTIISKIQERINATPETYRTIHIITEELLVWEKFRENEMGMLELFYKDKTKYGFKFQVLALLTLTMDLMGAYKSVGANDIIICERSPVTNINVFGKMLFDNKHITEMEWNLLKYIGNCLMVPVDKIVYLKTPVTECLRRVQHRDRIGEEDIDLNYLTQVHQHYEDCMNKIDHHKIQTDEDIEDFIDMMFNTEREIKSGNKIETVDGME
jgi:deoxyadenosine/deoxycytidine kinase